MLKRLFDLFFSIIFVVVFLPLFILTSIVVAISLGRPIFFIQRRIGLNGKPFDMIKFRSMTNETDENGLLLPNEERKTSFGDFLRSNSLDELPEFINVIKGDMSVVGPRPLLIDYLPYFTNYQKRRLAVKPGITGWAQVNGRNAIDWDQKLNLDVWYVKNQSLYLDLRIIVSTLVKVIAREDINHSDSVSMPRFDEYVRYKFQNDFSDSNEG